MTELPIPTHSSLPYRLRLPGPTAVPDRVMRAAAKPIVAHRGSRFLPVFKDVLDRLHPIFGRGPSGIPPFVFASTGIGGMESAVVNVVAPGERFLVCTNGQWGPVFRRLIENVGGVVDEVVSPHGAPIDLDGVKSTLAGAGYTAVFAVHSESSTGALADLQALGAIVAETDAILVVDTVSGLAGAEMRADDWGVDVAVTGCQKALMSPPGLAIASVSEKAWRVIEKPDRGPRSYFDYRKFRPNSEKGEPTYTAPVAMLNALHEALLMIGEEGLENAIARHLMLSGALRAGMTGLGFSVFPTATPTPTCQVFYTPEGIDAPAFIKHMVEVYNTEFAATRLEEHKGRMVRIGTMGCVSEQDILGDIHLSARALADMGRPVDVAPALKAASEAMI